MTTTDHSTSVRYREVTARNCRRYRIAEADTDGMRSAIGAVMVYATCVTMVAKWYPERKGGKTGFVNGGFAYGSVPFVFLFTSYMDVSNYRTVLACVGIGLCLVVAAAGWFFKDP